MALKEIAFYDLMVRGTDYDDEDGNLRYDNIKGAKKHKIRFNTGTR